MAADLGATVTLQDFPDVFQSGSLILGLFDQGLQHFAFAIDGSRRISAAIIAPPGSTCCVPDRNLFPTPFGEPLAKRGPPRTALRGRR